MRRWYRRDSLRTVLPVIGLAFGMVSYAAGQTGRSSPIFFDAIPFAGDSGSAARLDMYAAVPFAALDFERDDDLFTARYRLRIRVERGPDVAFDTTWTRNIQTTNYDKTIGRVQSFEFFQHRVHLKPGEYRTSLEILDFGTNLQDRVENVVAVPRFGTRPLELSGLMLVSRIRKTDEGYAITPLLNSNVSLAGDDFFIFFEAYNRTGVDTMAFRSSYIDRDSNEIWSDTSTLQVPPGSSRQWIRFPVEGIGRGGYLLKVVAGGGSAGDSAAAVASRTIRFEGTVPGMPLSEAEIRDKVSQLRYVANQSEMDYIRSAATFTDMRKRYAEFWNERDPTPGTPRNEAMLEYFRRIEYANTNFQSYAEGWLTDMGRVYVVYGPPDRIDRDPFPADGKPREVWEYYARRMTLVFIDQTGFGDYRLRTPVPLSEKYQY